MVSNASLTSWRTVPKSFEVAEMKTRAVITGRCQNDLSLGEHSWKLFPLSGRTLALVRRPKSPYREDAAPSPMAVVQVLNSFANCETLVFLRFVLRSEENLLQNCASLCNAA